MHALLVYAAVLAQTSALKVGATVPDLSAKGSDGKNHSLKAMAETGPVYLYFVKEVCSANPFAVKHFNAMYDKYGKKIEFFAVINAGQDGHASWKDQFGAQFPALYDPQEKIIAAFGLQNSQWVFKLEKGKVSKVFAGFGTNALNPLNDDLAKTAGMKKAHLTFEGAPTRLTFG